MNNIETRANSAAGKGGRQFPAWLVMVLLVLVTMGLYWPAMSCGFVNYDDPLYVTENWHVQGGLTWSGVKWAFYNTGQAAYWAPLMWLSHELACQLFGLQPWGHHLINLLLHAANTVLVYLLFRRLTGAFWQSAIVAALFGWHPLRVESVVWVTERKDVLSICFGLLTLITYARYVEKSKVQSSKSKVWYGLALLLFALGLMSKAMLVTWPMVMVLLDWWPLKRFKVQGSGFKVRSLVWEKVPFFGLAVAASVVTFMAQRHGGAMHVVASLPLGARGGNAWISYCRYLGKLFWPKDLSVFYPHPGYWPMGEVLLAGVLLLGMTVLCIMVRRRYPFMLMGWLWYVGTLVPVIGLVQVGDQAMADRFTYIPSLGVLVMVVWGVCELGRQWRYRVMIWSVMGCGAIMLCLGMTRQQLGYWKDDEALFRHALEVTKNNFLAHNNLGAILLKNNLLDEAMDQFQEAIRLEPDYDDARNNLGTVFLREGQFDEAINQYQKVIRLEPDYAAAHNNLGVAFGQKGQLDKAISQFQEAIRLNADFAEAFYNLGTALGRKGQTDEAIHQFQEAIRLKADYAEARSNLIHALQIKNAPSGR